MFEKIKGKMHGFKMRQNIINAQGKQKARQKYYRKIQRVLDHDAKDRWCHDALPQKIVKIADMRS